MDAVIEAEQMSNRGTILVIALVALASLVVWTYQPSYLPRIGVGNAEFVEKIASVVARCA